MTALYIATRFNHIEIVKLLIENNADIEICDIDVSQSSQSFIHV